MSEAAWKLHARRDWATGAYATKVGLARLYGVSPTAMYEALDPEMGLRNAEARKVCKREQYARNPEFRAAEISRCSANQRSDKSRNERERTRYWNNPAYREFRKAKSNAQYAKTRNGRVERVKEDA